jgi:hypothetical protein
LALVIGCGYSHNEILSLSGTVNDANNMEKFLTQRGYQVTNMNDKQYTQNNVLYPNKQNILTQMKNLLVTAIDKKIYNCVIYFAGHGIQDEFNHNPNERDGKDECIIPSSFDINNPETAIKDDDINEILNDTIKYHSKMNLFMMFDCCHSATNADLRYTYDHNGRLDGSPNLSFNTDIDASIIKLSGCLDSGSSFEAVVNGQSQGILTSSFIDILNDDESLTQNIFLITKKIYTYTSRYGQNPRVSASQDLNNSNNSRQILNYTVSVNNDIANVFSDDEDNNDINNETPNNELNIMDIEKLFGKNEIKSVPINISKPKPTYNNIDLFGPMASTFNKIHNLPHNTNETNMTNNNMEIINNLKISSSDLIKYLI